MLVIVAKRFLKVTHLHMVIKEKSPLLLRNFALRTTLLYLPYSMTQKCCLPNCLFKTFLKTQILKTQVSQVNATVQGSIVCHTHFLLCADGLPNNIIFNIAVYGDDTTLYPKCDQASDKWQQLELASELESDLEHTVDRSKKWLVDFNAGKTQMVWFDQSNNTSAIDVTVDGSALVEKSIFKMMGLSFSSKLDCSSYIISIAKTASKKIRALIHSMNFLYPEVTIYLYKSTIQSCMKYSGHVWAGALSCYLKLLHKLQKTRHVGHFILHLLPLLKSCLV